MSCGLAIQGLGVHGNPGQNSGVSGLGRSCKQMFGNSTQTIYSIVWFIGDLLWTTKSARPPASVLRPLWWLPQRDLRECCMPRRLWECCMAETSAGP
eukprot:1342344-Lingulodinium_polyedra.AAC.1